MNSKRTFTFVLVIFVVCLNLFTLVSADTTKKELENAKWVEYFKEPFKDKDNDYTVCWYGFYYDTENIWKINDNGFFLDSFSALTNYDFYVPGVKIEMEIATNAEVSSGFAFRIPDNGSYGFMFGGGKGNPAFAIADQGYGIAFDIKNDSHAGKFVLSFCNGEMRKAPFYTIAYPDGFDPAKVNKYTVYDYGEWIYVFVNDKVIAHINLTEDTGSAYEAGVCYDDKGNKAFEFNQQTVYGGYASMYNRIGTTEIKSYSVYEDYEYLDRDLNTETPAASTPTPKTEEKTPDKTTLKITKTIETTIKPEDDDTFLILPIIIVLVILVVVATVLFITIRKFGKK